MKKMLFLSVMAVSMSLGLSACGDDDKGKGTGAKTFGDAVQKLCEDYVVGCKDASGQEITLDECQAAQSAEWESDESAECNLATVDFTYCVMREYPGDHCHYYYDDDMEQLSASDQLDILQTCMSLFEKMQKVCSAFDDDDPLENQGGTNTSDEVSAQKLCSDYVVGCEGTDGIALTLDECMMAFESTSMTNGDETCRQAFVNYAYCAMNVISIEDRCRYSNMDITSMTEDEQMAVAMNCSSQAMAYVSACGEY